MTSIIGSRASGKTEKLMEWANENNAIIICANPQHFLTIARMKGFSNVRFASYNELFNNDYSKETIYIDEMAKCMEYYIKYYTDNNFVGYTLTTED